MEYKAEIVHPSSSDTRLLEISKRKLSEGDQKYIQLQDSYKKGPVQCGLLSRDYTRPLPDVESVLSRFLLPVINVRLDWG